MTFLQDQHCKSHDTRIFLRSALLLDIVVKKVKLYKHSIIAVK